AQAENSARSREEEQKCVTLLNEIRGIEAEIGAFEAEFRGIETEIREIEALGRDVGGTNPAPQTVKLLLKEVAGDEGCVSRLLGLQTLLEGIMSEARDSFSQ
ncbi:hypothetical protein KIPB_015866, partial [Kipferlia bialata]